MFYSFVQSPNNQRSSRTICMCGNRNL